MVDGTVADRASDKERLSAMRSGRRGESKDSATGVLKGTSDFEPDVLNLADAVLIATISGGGKDKGTVIGIFSGALSIGISGSRTC